PRAFGNWRESRLLTRANDLLATQDPDGAMQAAHDMLRYRHRSVGAFRILAEATERQNRSETVAWRAQIARALPQNLDAQLNLASAALRFGQLDTARQALDRVPPSDRDQAAYHVVAGWLARAQGNEKDVETHFAAALAREPANELYQFNLAVLRIHAVDRVIADEARATLERLSKVSGYRTGSLRALLSDAIERDDLPRADTLAQDLQMTQQITFADYLLCLDFYRKLDGKKFAAVLDKIKPVATRKPGDLARLMDWMIDNGMAPEVLKWSEKLPAEVVTAAPPAISIAEAFAETRNWSRLKRWTRSNSWGDSDYLRLAYQAYATRQAAQPGAEAEFNGLWRSADHAAGENPEHAASLARLAMRWNLLAEAEQLWQRVAKFTPMRREALDALARIYRGNNSLPQLLEMQKQLQESSPREPALAANYARLALIIAPTTEDAQRKAKAAYEMAPLDPNCAVTYAFALYNLGRTSEGLKILRTLPKEQLFDSHAAVYAVVLLVDDGEFQAAQEFVAAARGGPLFPEERKLLDEAVSKIPPATASPPPDTAAPSPSPAPSATP
ncbi:MAG: tetratricopeptide repeat protein, partial [Chthoniobacterales bacterium]